VKLSAENLQAAAGLAAWRRSLMRGWHGVKVGPVEASGGDPLHVGSELNVKAKIHLGALTPDDVQVQLFHGLVDNMGEIPRPATAPMGTNGSAEGGVWVYEGVIPCRSSGQFGYVVRVLPKHADLATAFEPGLVCWG